MIKFIIRVIKGNMKSSFNKGKGRWVFAESHRIRDRDACIGFGIKVSKAVSRILYETGRLALGLDW